MRRRRRKKDQTIGRLEAVLDQVRGKSDESHDSRDRSRFQGFRTLDLQRHGEIFDRLVALDYDYLLGQRFAASPRVLADLLPQSVVGRALNGHGWFTDEFGTSLRFPDATFERVLTALEAGDPNLKGYLVRTRRGQMLERFATWLLERLDRPEIELIVDGAPLFGIDFLADARVETRGFATGLVLAGYMDDHQYRRTSMLEHKRTFQGFPYQIGYGEILIVDRERFLQCGLEDTGATPFDEEQLRTLRDVGVICRDRHSTYRYPEYDQAYFRRRMGDGVCDDLALIRVGAEYGYSAMLGAFVMDAIDTYDKYLLDLTWGGFDTHLAGRIQKHFLNTEEQPLVGDRAILDLIHFAAKNNDPGINLSSSHRRLIQFEKESKVPTLVNHWWFLQGEPVYDIKLGFGRVPARQFYDVAWKRLQAAGFSVDEPSFLTRSKN